MWTLKMVAMHCSAVQCGWVVVGDYWKSWSCTSCIHALVRSSQYNVLSNVCTNLYMCNMHIVHCTLPCNALMRTTLQYGIGTYAIQTFATPHRLYSIEERLDWPKRSPHPRTLPKVGSPFSSSPEWWYSRYIYFPDKLETTLHPWTLPGVVGPSWQTSSIHANPFMNPNHQQSSWLSLS